MKMLPRFALLLVFVTSTSFAFAATQSVNTFNKTYQLSQIKLVVANDPQCKKIGYILFGLEGRPLSFSFTRQADNSFSVTDREGVFQNHQYRIVSQTANNVVVDRIGMGSFTYHQQDVEYVVSIAADTTKSDFKYIYPVILSADHSHCYFTALLNPDMPTQNTFKKAVQSGSAAAGNDLTGS